MFTGLVEALGKVAEIRLAGPGRRLVIAAPGVSVRTKVGDSVAISGCCLTVIEARGDNVTFEAGPETLSRTNLGRLKPGDQVNLERALLASDRLGGHFVTGHIDALGVLDQRIDEGDWSNCWFRFPAALAGQIVSKGSIAVDGISLTVVDVESERFSVQLIPHTLAVTTLGWRLVGEHVNLETDLLAKYVEKQLREVRSAE